MRRISDPLLFGLCLTATVLGLFVVLDAGYARSLASDRGAIPTEFFGQVKFLGPAIVLGFLLGGIRPNRWQRYAKGIWLATVLAIVAVKFVGVTQNGARRWLGVGSASLQPAEFAKLAVILFLAAFLANRPVWSEVVRPWRDFPTWLDNVAVPKLQRCAPFLTVLVAAYFIEDEPDLGTAAILLATAFLMFLPGRVTFKTLAVGAVLGALVGGVIVKKQPYRMERITNHVRRWDKGVSDDAGYQTTQSEQGMADGGLFGVGIGRGRAKSFLPATTTDFIMATIGEEAGLAGVLGVLGLLGAITARLYVLANRAPTEFGRLTLYGICAWFGIQTCTNAMMANGFLPAIGIPLPFFLVGRVVAPRFMVGGRRGAVGLPRAFAGASSFAEGGAGATLPPDGGAPSGTSTVRLILTGGGTGGHIYPALEVGRAMAERGASLRYLGSHRGQESAACAKLGISYEGFGSEPLWSLKTPKGWRAVARLARATRDAKRSLRGDRPDAVFSTGGYSAAPIMAAARSLGVPYVVHEGNSIPGRTTRMFAPGAAAVGCTFRTTEGRLPGAVRTGHPVRRELREAAIHRKETPLVVVVGGSQGARFLNEGVPFAARGIEGLDWLHATGPAGYEEFRSRAFPGYEIVPYIEADRLAETYAHARLAVARSGSTLAELAAFRLPSVLVPLPTSADDHQRFNAKEFEAMGAAIVVEQEGGDLGEAIRQWVEDEIRRERAKRALAEWDIPDATTRLADIIEEAARRNA